MNLALNIIYTFLCILFFSCLLGVFFMVMIYGMFAFSQWRLEVPSSDWYLIRLSGAIGFIMAFVPMMFSFGELMDSPSKKKEEIADKDV